MDRGGSRTDRPERRTVEKEQVSKQRMYDDYTTRKNSYATETGRREPYHLTYARKMKEKEENDKTRDKRDQENVQNQ